MRSISYINDIFFGNPYSQDTSIRPDEISDFISKVQFERLAHDIKMWRDAIREMELAYYPMRVMAQRMYMDTVLNGEVKAIIERWQDLTLQRDYSIYQFKGGKRVESVDLTQQLEEQDWFQDYISTCLDAPMYGYSLIELGNIVDSKFPNVSFTRRENIRIDDKGNPILSNLVYGLSGIQVKDDKLINMFNHWIPTKTDRGVSKCGYGLLYIIALYEIHLRHATEWSMDYTERYGMPIAKGYTRKVGKERDKFKSFLRGSASSAWILLDKSTDDDVIYETAKDAGTAWKIYGDLENRLKGTISKLVLGHEDAMQSLPGKLGGMQAANKDGFNESLIEQAMNSKQIRAGNFVARAVNEIGAPRFRQIGEYVGSDLISGLFPAGYKFAFKNDKEEYEIQRRTNAHRTLVSSWVGELNKAGWNVKKEELEGITGLTLTEAPPETKQIQERTTKSEIIKKED